MEITHSSMFEELEKLREANQLAQTIIARQKKQLHTPLSEIGNTVPSFQQEPISVDEESNSYDDIWGASQYLSNANDKITFVKQYLKNTSELLLRDEELLKVVEPTDYEIVDNIDLLTVNKNEQGSDYHFIQSADEADNTNEEIHPSAVLSEDEELNFGETNTDRITEAPCISITGANDYILSESTGENDMQSTLSCNENEQEIIPKSSSTLNLSSSLIHGSNVQFNVVANSPILDASFLDCLLKTEDEGVSNNDGKETKDNSEFSENTVLDYTESRDMRYELDDAVIPPLISHEEKPVNKKTFMLEKFPKQVEALSNSFIDFTLERSTNATKIVPKLHFQFYKSNQSTTKTGVSNANCVWDILPDEMILNIFSYLSRKDLNLLSLVNHRFYNLTKDSCLWHRVEASDMELNCEFFKKFQNARPKYIYFHRCSAKGLSSKVLRQFFQNCKTSLRRIHVSECMHESLFGDNVLLHVSSHCSKVESISVPWSNTTDNGISTLATFSTLVDLNISGNCFISDESFIPLMQKLGGSLQTLKVNGCFALTGKSFIAIAENCHSVNILEIGLCTKVTSECVQLLAKSLLNLKELDLRNLKSVNDDCVSVISKHCKLLSKLVLANCTLVTNSGLSNLAFELSKLKDLDISGCSKVTDIGVSTLAAGLSNPRCLNLSSTSISYASILTLTENCYGSLQVLKLSFCNNITEDCIMKLISFCFKLTCLHLHGCKRVSVKSLRAKHKHLNICS